MVAVIKHIGETLQGHPAERSVRDYEDRAKHSGEGLGSIGLRPPRYLYPRLSQDPRLRGHTPRGHTLLGGAYSQPPAVGKLSHAAKMAKIEGARSSGQRRWKALTSLHRTAVPIRSLFSASLLRV